jgi:WD40 repeat protein
VKLVTYTRPDGIALSRDGRLYAQLELDESQIIEILDLFDTDRHFELQLPEIGDRPVAAMNLDLLAFHPSSRSVYILGPNGRIREVDIQGRKISGEWQAHDSDVMGVSITPCGRFLVTAGSSGDLATWHLPQREPLFKPDSGSRPDWLGPAAPLDDPTVEFRTVEFG